MSELSIIVPTCSRQVPLEQCLRSLVHQSLSRERYEIVLVNNGDKEHARLFIAPIVQAVDPGIRVLQAPKNLGYAGGCRYGVDNTDSEYIIFHNDDAIADPAWLALALSEFKKTPDLGALVCRVVDATGPRIQHEGVTQVVPNALFWQTGWGEIDSPKRFEEPRVDLEFFGGCIWGTTRSVWEKVGGLGNLYHPGYYEDTEFGLRCRQLGYRIRLLTQVTCSHYGSLTLGSASNAYWIAFHRSRLLFLLRNRTVFRNKEILRAEWRWWMDIGADSHPFTCLLGWITAIPRIPRALMDRRQFKKKCLQGL